MVVLRKLLSGRVEAVVQRQLCRAHVGMHNPPVFALAHLKRRSGLEIENLHSLS